MLLKAGSVFMWISVVPVCGRSFVDYCMIIAAALFFIFPYTILKMLSSFISSLVIVS